MNKFGKIVLAGGIAMSLVGCSDASAKLPDSSTTLFKVGNNSVSKGEVYSTMMSMAGATTAINDATNTIATAEVEVTDEIQKQAESTLSTYKSVYGDTFATYLDGTGMTEDEYLNSYLIPSLLASELPKKYVEEQWDTLMTTYKPVMATVLQFNSYEDLTAAKAELNAGDVDATTAAANHNSTSSGISALYTTQSTDLDSMVRAVISSLTPEDGWAESAGTDTTQYLVRVDDNDVENYRDDVVTTLTSLSTISSDATTFFIKKYGFHIYDITLYNAISAQYPDNLVQNLPNDTDEK